MMETVKAVRAAEIFLVTGLNNDPHDISAGGSPEIGLFFFVAEGEEGVFMAGAKDYLTKIGKASHVQEYRVTRGLLKEPGAVFSGTSGLGRMHAFLGDAQSWRVLGL